MKILHVVPSLHLTDGGLSEYVPMTAMAQLRAGLDVAIAFYDVGELSEKAKEAERIGVKLIRFRLAPRKHNPAAFSWDFFHRFESVASEYDIIHTHIQWMFPIWWAAHVAKKLKKPLVVMPHGGFSATARIHRSAWKKRLVGWLDRRAVRYAASVWATAEKDAEEIRAYVPEAKVAVFPIGLDVKKSGMVREKVKVRGEGEGRTLLYLSRISPIKGLDMLAEAWGRIEKKAWKLLIVGSDDRGYVEELKRIFAEKCPEGGYEFRGPAYGEEKMKLLADADAFVLPSRSENFSISIAEAMASGLPVICTKGAPWECLQQEKAGWWTEVSADGLERALRELVSLADDELRAMGGNGRNWVAVHLDWSAIAVKMMACYSGMVEVGEERR